MAKFVEATAKPMSIRTLEDVEKACAWCEAMQAQMGNRIVIWEDYHPKRIIEKLSSFLWASQVTQKEGVCDSPVLQVIEARCKKHVEAQVERYSSVLNVADVAVHVASVLSDGAVEQHCDAARAALAKPDVDDRAAAALDEDDARAMVAHDEAVVRGRLSKEAEAAKGKKQESAALYGRALRIQLQLADSQSRSTAFVQQHFREQAFRHLRWSRRRSGLTAPYLLPGMLGELPGAEQEIVKEEE